MKTLFDEITNDEYRGISSKEYKDTILRYSEAMFNLFDMDRKYASGNLGMHIMWLGSWTSMFIGRDVVDYSIDNKVSLNNAFIEVLKLNTNSGKEDLDKILDLMNK